MEINNKVNFFELRSTNMSTSNDKILHSMKFSFNVGVLKIRNFLNACILDKRKAVHISATQKPLSMLYL